MEIASRAFHRDRNDSRWVPGTSFKKEGIAVAEFKYSNVAREMEVYGYDSVVKSHCRMCHGGCGVFVYVKDGKIKKIAGDPDCPINHGTSMQ